MIKYCKLTVLKILEMYLSDNPNVCTLGSVDKRYIQGV